MHAGHIALPLARLALACLSGLALSAAALAGEPPQGGELPRILVTADRIEASSVQETPLAVTALDEEAIRDARLVDLTGIARRVPGLAISAFNVGQAPPYIRGIGSNEDGAGGDSSVGVFLDEVYLGRSAAWAADLFGLERIEVLRGPQGTLYGRNVVGGAINLITRKPGFEPRREIDLDIGNLDYRQLRFDLSGALGEGDALAGISGVYKVRDGYLESPIPALRHLSQDRRGVRGQLILFPSPNSELNLSADYARIDESGPNRHLEGWVKETLLKPYDTRADDLLVSYDIDSGESVGEFWGVSARLDHEFDGVTLTSITALRESDLAVIDATWYDTDAIFQSPGFIPYETVVTVGENNYQDSARQFSQELRLSASRDAVEWLAGLYYYREKAQRLEGFDFHALLTPAATFDGGSGYSDQHNTTDSYALFGQLSYDFLDHWRLDLGGRYSVDHKRIHQRGKAGGFLMLEDYNLRTSKRWRRFTPKIALNYQPTNRLLGYASFSQGYKSGGYQGQAPTAIAAENPFDQELANSFEMGVKWTSEDQRLRLRTALFHIDYKDLQVLELFSPAGSPSGDLGISMTFNAADARSRGLEAEFVYTPVERWTLSGGYAWLDAIYTRFFLDEDLGFRFSNPVDRTGNRLRNAPRHSLNLDIAYRHPLPSGGEWLTRLNWNYTSKNYQEPGNLEIAAIPAYSLTNLRIAWRPNADLEMAAWVDNLFDERYLVHNFSVGPSSLTTPGPPRTFGVNVRYRF